LAVDVLAERGAGCPPHGGPGADTAGLGGRPGVLPKRKQGLEEKTSRRRTKGLLGTFSGGKSGAPRRNYEAGGRGLRHRPSRPGGRGAGKESGHARARGGFSREGRAPGASPRDRRFSWSGVEQPRRRPGSRPGLGRGNKQTPGPYSPEITDFGIGRLRPRRSAAWCRAGRDRGKKEK